jgi:hypothetical protein
VAERLRGGNVGGNRTMVVNAEVDSALNPT